MLPLKIMLDYLAGEVGCNITIIGIQPESLVFAGDVTPKVSGSIDYITSVIEKVIIQLEQTKRVIL
jgi:Ni,Fe-hydrogenase maturation factor